MNIFSKLINFLFPNFTNNEQPVESIETDVVGNPLKNGDIVIDVAYNEIRRRGYVTIKAPVAVRTYNYVPNAKQLVLKYDAFVNEDSLKIIQSSRNTEFYHVYPVEQEVMVQ